MKFTQTLVPAILAATITATLAQDATAPAAGTARQPRQPRATPAGQPAAFQPGGAPRNNPAANAATMGNAAANVQRNLGTMAGGGGMGGGMGGGQTPIDRIMTNEAAIAKTGIDKAKFDDIAKAYKEYNDKIADLQKNIQTQTDAQAKLVANRESTEDEVGAAVEALWKTRMEIAKLQTFKALKTNKAFTTEELTKIREVDAESRPRPQTNFTRPGATDGTAPGANPNRPGVTRPGAAPDGAAPGTNPARNNNPATRGANRQPATTPVAPPAN